MRRSAFILAILTAFFGWQPAQGADKAPYETVSNHQEIEAQANGTFVASREVRYRILTQAGIEAMNAQNLSFAIGYQRLTVAGYTLKADGRKIDVPQNNILWGNGQSSQKGFSDRRLVSVFFPNLEVGDSIVLKTLEWQDKPWFDGVFDYAFAIDRHVAQKDVVLVLTYPETMALHIDAAGLTPASEMHGEGKVRKVWHYRNDAPLLPQPDAVDLTDEGPHLIATSFDGYTGLAAAYRAQAADKAKATPQIVELAETLTKGVVDKREQAHILYDWVSTHIAYVGIVLGAGGFVPHPASSVLSNLYGDCKDHTVLLEALLSAKGIASTSVLIDGGNTIYHLSPVASAASFDHVITYLPDIALFVDSTAELSPFGTLPESDSGKPGLRLDTGEMVKTPVATAAASSIHVSGTVRIDPDGSASGLSTIRSNASFGTMLRAVMQNLPTDKDDEYMRTLFGPGAEGKIERGTPRVLKDPYEISATFRAPFIVAWPGPVGLPFRLSFLPIDVLDLATGRMPPTREGNYVCPSMGMHEELTITLPNDTQILAMPTSQNIDARDMHLHLTYTRTDAHTIRRDTALAINHPEAFCTPAYYTAIRPELTKMVRALRQQIIVKTATDKRK